MFKWCEKRERECQSYVMGEKGQEGLVASYIWPLALLMHMQAWYGRDQLFPYLIILKQVQTRLNWNSHSGIFVSTCYWWTKRALHFVCARAQFYFKADRADPALTVALSPLHNRRAGRKNWCARARVDWIGPRLKRSVPFEIEINL